jgi:hypothetical protein
MSNAGQAALTIVGTAVGFAVGMPQLGFMLGSLAGNALFPTQLPNITGPRLTDHNTTAADVGGAVAEVLGTMPVGGTVIWLGPRVEVSTTEEVGGKGGPEQDVTTFSYYQSIAVGLCRAPPDGEMGGLWRIWENGKLVYDVRAQQDFEDSDQYLARLEASSTYAEGFVLYLGGENQLPDPTIEAQEGIGYVPAFRELMYIVFPMRQLQDDQGRRHPQFQFEVTDGPVNENIDPDGTDVVLRLDFDDQAQGSTTFLDSSDYQHVVNSSGSAQVDTVDPVCGSGNLAVSQTGQLTVPHSSVFNVGAADFTIEFWFRGAMNEAAVLFEKQTNTTLYPFEITLPVGAGGAPRFIGAIGTTGPGGQGPGTTAFNCNAPSITDGTWHHVACERWGTVFSIFRDGTRYADTGGGGGIVAGTVIQPLADNLEPIDILNPSGSWGSQFAHMDRILFTKRAKYQATNFTPAQCGDLTAAPLSIADCLERVAERAGLDDSQIDVEGLRDNLIDGWGMQRVMTGRDAIQSLIPVGLFDVVESGDLIKFPPRGRGIVGTLQVNDLGARVAGSEPGPAIKSSRTDDVELPRQIRLHYMATSRDYEPGEQLSVQRISTDAQQVVDVTAAVAISDTKALQTADILWSDAWAGAWAHEVTLDRSYSWLEGADCINVPINGRWERCRVTGITDQGGLLRQLRLVNDDDGAYTSARIAEAPNRPPNVLQVYRDTELILLDLPALRDTDDNAGIYGAVRATGSGTEWGGALIWRSLDGTGGWTNLASAAAEASIGRVVTPAAAGITTTWDDENSLTITLESGSLASATEAQLLAGANTAAVGVNGRWELLQFLTATQISATQWTLSNLLRGRRGTEHWVGTGAVDDRFILVSGAGVFRLPVDIADIGQDRVYRAVSAGKPFAGGLDQTFASQAVALLPFAPVYFEVENVGGDLVFSWIRRGRLGRALPSGADIPLSEESEAYVLDIYAAGSPTQVVRTISTAVQSATYTVAQQVADFGSPGPYSITAMVYQVSATIGRGTPAEIIT